jgi:hypothetical protein
MKWHYAAIALLIALFASSVRAHEIETGRGVVCDRQDQLERFAALDGTPTAVETINATEAHACAFLNVQYIKGAAVGTTTVHTHPMRIVEILVLAVNKGRGWEAIAPVIQYTLFAIEEGAA